MENPRKYGNAPFNIAVIHGGPGAAGEMAPVAEKLSADRGILEPIQTEKSLDGQVEELRTILNDNSELPVTLVGFSWGAWLAVITAARYSGIIKKLILVSSGPYEEKYAPQIHKTRIGRLDTEERIMFDSALNELNDPQARDTGPAIEKLHKLLLKTDSYDTDTEKSADINFEPDIFRNVWPQAAELRKSGELIQLAAGINCPVTAIHGDFDPHPAEGVKEPLTKVLKNFEFILLKNCGHTPWIERRTRNEFFDTLKRQM